MSAEAGTAAADIPLFLDFIHDLRITNALALASLVVLVYDILLTFPEELRYVWSTKLTTGKALFFLNRYPVVAVSAIIVANDLDFSSDLELQGVQPPGCLVYVGVYNTGPTYEFFPFVQPKLVAERIGIFCTVIFCLRTAALWERNRTVIAFLVVLVLSSDCAIAVCVWLVERSVRFSTPTQPGIQSIFGCYGDIASVSQKLIVPAVAALMVFDAAVFVLTLVRIIMIRRNGEGKGAVVKILFRDGFAYYVIVLASSIANLVMYAVLPSERAALLGSLVPILRTVMSVCASRLVLNLRGIIDRARTQTWSAEELTSTTHEIELELQRWRSYGHAGRRRSAAIAAMTATARPLSAIAVSSLPVAQSYETVEWKQTAIVSEGGVVFGLMGPEEMGGAFAF
ncbi:hypothetical protein DFH11DRAFT_1110342 [Phellopilus nigrolimitatus]|nr:hypothetical protein DFH11DRAFT_1110342 [Phellopilus nigrolimitatus]